MRSENWKSLAGYYTLEYVVAGLCTALFLTEVKEWSASTWLLMLTALPVYAFFYIIPGGAVTVLAALICRRKRFAMTVSGVAAGAGSALTQILLLSDFGLFRGFGFHFNLFVWNLLTTPGGFSSMGLRSNNIIPLALAMALLVALNAAAAWFMLFFRSGMFGVAVSRIFRGWRKYAIGTVLILCGVCNGFIFAWNHYVKNPAPLLASGVIPAYQRVTMHGFFSETLKISEPDREELLMRTGRSGGIDYPKAPIRRRADRKRYNVVWLACESWRSDMLDPEIMPRTAEFAAKHGVSFRRNYSGGNGTRQGMFSMFYGLYGSYWHPFLASRTGALLIDWMIEDGYEFGCFTSAKFSYPEFDQTIFSKLPSEVLHSDDDGLTYTRDERNTARLIEFIRAERGGKPFMAFMFFESPHAPYEFPEERARFSDYADKVTYLGLGAGESERIKNRYRNSCYTLDGFLDRVFTVLREENRLDDTIVVLIGDHGEEFFEKGRLGHNSDFVQEQILTPLVLHLPGVKPGVYDRMSSHLDVPAMLAPYFGVENPPSDFSLGKNLLSPEAPERRYTVVAGWDQLFFAGEKYKMLLPVNSFDAVVMQLRDGEDRPLPDRSVFFRECRDELVEVQRDLRRFLK